jgi:nitrogen fixation protein NifB
MEPTRQPTTAGASPALHPCYSEQAHRHFARLHLAVAPACNIQCHYCNRKYDCSNESRPGVVSELLTPEQAVQKALAVGAAIPHLAVVGVAGPGDPLANPERVFATFRELAEKAPDLTLCVSTNGLALPEQVEELVKYRIGHVTITINCIDPDIGARIYPWIFWNHRRIRGRKAAEILIAQQQKGLEMLVERGVLVKVNSVLIPGVNDEHLHEVHRVVKAKGAFLHNIMPLIARPEHGAYYGLIGQAEPTAEQVRALRTACASESGESGMMNHCQQCRADAVGMLGQDRGAEFTLEKVAAMEVDWRAALAKRAAVRATIERRLAMQAEFLQARRPTPLPVRRPPIIAPETLRMAVGSSDGRTIDLHFGHARTLLIFDVSPTGARLVARRGIDDRYCSGPTTCGDTTTTLAGAIEALRDCTVLLCARIGFEPWRPLEEAGIQPNSEHAMEPIREALLAVYREWRDGGRLETDPNRVRSSA